MPLLEGFKVMHVFIRIITSPKIAICFLMFAMYSNGFAATMTVTIGSRDWKHEAVEAPTFIYLNGEIDKGAPQRFSQVLNKLPDRPGGIWVVLNSPGGDLFAGMEIGRIIRKYGATTSIGINNLTDPELFPSKGECLSACSLAFLGGSYRNFLDGSIYGVHRVSSSIGPRSIDLDVGQILSAAIGSYIREMGADPGLFDLMVKAGKSEIYILSEEEAKKLKVINNGRLPPEWSIEATPEGTYLKGLQDTVHGEGKFTFSCNGGVVIIFSFYQAGERAKVIANGGWFHSLMIDSDLVPLPAPSMLKDNNYSIEALFILKKSQFPFKRVMSAKQIGHVMQLSREAPTYVGYVVEFDDKSVQRVRNYIENCEQNS